MGSSGNFRGRKRSIYEGGIRASPIVSLARQIPAGKVDEQSVIASVDFFPTMAALAGTSASASLPGENGTDVFMGKHFARKGNLYCFSKVFALISTPPQLRRGAREAGWYFISANTFEK